MTPKKMKLPFIKRRKFRTPREREDPCAVFRAFVHALARMRAQTKNISPERS